MVSPITTTTTYILTDVPLFRVSLPRARGFVRRQLGMIDVAGGVLEFELAIMPDFEPPHRRHNLKRMDLLLAQFGAVNENPQRIHLRNKGMCVSVSVAIQ